MNWYVHQLAGCAPTPLAHYLKALAVLRLVSEQRDTAARGFWKEEAFWLATQLSREELLRFFLDAYRPTPILSPWNAGSGFYYEEDAGLTPIERSVAPRFEPYRAGVAAARRMCEPLASAIAALKTSDNAAKQDKSPAAVDALKQARVAKDEAKDLLLGACRRSWSGGLLEWFDAALALGADGGAAWPAILGSGGNDGRLDFTNNSMKHLATLFDCSDPEGAATVGAASLLAASLFRDPAPGLSDKAVGQFLPGSAGGDNMGTGFRAESRVNPWDFVLLLEGSVVVASSIVRTADSAELPQAAAPFAVRSSGAGYGSASIADEGPRGEQWMPLWTKPATYPEIRVLFAEGRTRVGRASATRPLDAARALARLGAARGIVGFERYGFIERNGQSNLAVPLGRWAAAAEPRDDLLDAVEPWAAKVRSFARDKLAPKSVTTAARRLDEAMLAVCRGGGSARFQELLIAVGHAEAAILRSPNKAGDPKRGLSPIPSLDAAWIRAIDDGTPEVRLAVALASQDVALRFGGSEVLCNVRAHWMPVDRRFGARRVHVARPDARFAKGAGGLASDPDVICGGRDLERDLIALVRRRVSLAPTLAARGIGLFGAPRAEAFVGDVMLFLRGQVDDARILALARPLMAVAWRTVDRELFAPVEDQGIDAAYAIARLAHLSEALDVGETITVPVDAEPSARLAAGDVAGAIAICLRRLRATGLRPAVRWVVGDARRARRLLASLAFPISRRDLTRCADLVTKPYELEEPSHAD